MDGCKRKQSLPIRNHSQVPLEKLWMPSVNIAEFLDEVRTDSAQNKNDTSYHSRVLLWLGIIRPQGPV